MQAKIARITDILRRDDGISGAMHYTEQISWILFLKFLNDYEQNKSDEAAIKQHGTYEHLINDEHKWNTWACPKDEKGKIDLKEAKTGSDLIKYVNTELFPYLKNFKNSTQDPKSIKYIIGAIFEYLDNKIASGHTLREILDIIDDLNFQSKKDLFELSQIYENLLKGMGSDGGNSGEFYTPRPVIKAMVQALDPKVGQTVYDGALGSAGFLVEAFEHMKEQKNITAKNWKFLQNDTFFGREKTPLAYVMGVMNMILHGVENPNIYKQNTLTTNIRDIQEKDRFDIILANPPFGGKERPQIQQNFPIKANATELLFLQHFMKSIKVNGKAAIIVPEGVLFQTNNAFQQVKKELLENFNLHTIVSLPAGVFLPYSGVNTNIIFFERKGATSDIWYYEVKPSYNLTKNKPIHFEHFEEFIELFSTRKTTNNSWIMNIKNIKNYDLSSKNPRKNTKKNINSPTNILKTIESNNKKIVENTRLIKKLFEKEFKESISSSKKVKLEDICTIVGGGTPRTNIPDYWNGDVIWLSPTDLPEIGKITYLKSSTKKITKTGLDKSSAKLLPKGSVVFSSRATIGKIGICEVELCTNQGFTNFICGKEINNKFLAYTLKFFTPDITELSNSTTFKEVNKTAIKNFEILLPNIKNQEEIVKKIDEILETLDQLNDVQNEQTNNSKELEISILETVFS